MNPTSFRNPAMLRNPLVVAALLIAAPIAAQGQTIGALEPIHVYGQIGLGGVVQADELTQTITLSNVPARVQLQGRTALGRGGSYALAIGRQTRAEPSADRPEPLHWRLEGEWWQAQMPRQRFEAGQLKATLNDSMEASGLFVNALVRLAAGERTRWWMGAGIGQVRVALPDAGAAAPGCGCLAAASGSGVGYRFKTSVERQWGESSAVVAELAYTKLPDAATATGTLPSVKYQPPSPVTAQLGVKLRF